MEANTAVKKKKRTKFGRSRTYQLYGIMAIPLLAVIIWSYLPMVGIIMAFKNYKYNKGIFGSPWVGLKNFSVFLKSDDCFEIIRNTIGMNVLFIVFGMLAALLLALVFYNLRSRIAVKAFQTVTITPHFISWVVVAYMAFVFLNPNGGMLNAILNAFGLESVQWYSNPKPWPVILVIANTWKNVGMDMVMLYAALMGIDETVIEAGRIDGATEGQIKRKIIIPEIMSLISILLVLKVGGIFNADFGLFYQLPRDSGQLYSVTDVISTYTYRMMMDSQNYGVSTAIGLLQSVVGLVLVMVTNKLSKMMDPDNGLF